MTGDYLFELLPRYYRWRDSELSGNALDPHAMGPLQRYLAHLQDVVVDELRAAIGQLYDNLFIETCEPWVIPLIADLVGLEATTDRGDGPTRSQVANAIGHEARKGLAITITEAVEDATGWPARVRAAVDRIAFTQSVSAPVTDRGVTIDVRPPSPPGAHLMDVRVRQPAARPHPRSGNLGLQPNTVSVAVWPTQIYPMRRAALRAVGPGRYTFNPLGVDTSVLEMPPNHRVRDGRPADEASIYVDGRLLDPSDLTTGDLASWQPSDLGGRPTAVLDPTRGRLWLRDDAKHVAADFAYGLCGDIGGGPYLRGGDHRAGDHRHRVDIGRDRTGTESGRHAGPPTLRQAIDQLDTILAREAGRGESAVVLAIADNELHRVAGDSVTDGPVVRVPDTVSVIIRAEDGYRPCLVGDIVILGRGRFILDGCIIAGSIRVAGPVSVELRHCTVANLDPPTGPWPGRPSVVVEAGVDCRVSIADSIMGPVAGSASTQLEVRDSIIDGGGGHAIVGVEAGPPQVTIGTATVLGLVAASRLDAESVLFLGEVAVSNPTVGSTQRSYFAENSSIPSDKHGHIDAEGRTRFGGWAPTLVSRTYGDPGYAQLSWQNADFFLEGGVGGDEIGVFNKVRTAHRLARMQRALDRFIPVGLQAAVEPMRP